MQFRRRGILVIGTVVELERQRSRHRSWVYTPIIEYHVADKSYRLKPPVAMNPALYDLGESVPIYYLPGQPGNSRLITPREFRKWLIVLASCLLFLALLLAPSLISAD